MEYSVIQSDLTDRDIRASAALSRYAELVSAWNQDFLKKKGESVQIAECVSCGSKKLEPAFQKQSMSYLRCGDCRSLFVQLRPASSELSRYFQDSEARSFWHREIGEKTKEARSKKLIRPLLDWIETHLGENDISESAPMILFRPNHSALSQEARLKFSGVSAFDPQFSKADAKAPATSATSETPKAIVVFQALTYSVKPRTDLEWISGKLKKGGLAFLTPILSTGLDIEIGGGSLPGILPPDHLNLFSLEGLQKLAGACGFDIVEFGTPGSLDAKHVEWMTKDPTLAEKVPPFLRYWMQARPGENLLQELQEFLQRHRLSSLGRVVLRKNR